MMQAIAHLSSSVLILTIVSTLRPILAYYRNCYEEQAVCLITQANYSSFNNEYHQTREEAKHWCERNSSSLAKITDKELQDTIVTFIKDSSASLNSGQPIFTNGRRSRTSRWHWINGEESVTVPPGAYNNLYYAYFNLNDGVTRLYSGYPTTKRRFICSHNTDVPPCDRRIPFGGRCYIVSSYDATWFDARSRCLEENAELAIFESNFRLSQITSIRSNEDFWIGLLKEMWYWSNDTKMNYYNWEENYPSNTGGNCLCLNRASGKWINCNCGASCRFICMQDISGATTSKLPSTLTNTTQSSTETTTFTAVEDDLNIVGSQKNGSNILYGIILGIAALLLVAIIVLVVLFVKKKKSKRQVQSADSSHCVDERPASKTHELEHVYQIENPNEAYAEIGTSPGTVYAAVVSSGRRMSIADKTPTNMVYAELDIAPMKGDNDTTKVQYVPQSSQSPDTVYANYNPTK